MLRPMTPDEEVNLAMAVMQRQFFGLPATEYAMTQMRLPEDLRQLVRAGLEYEEVDLMLSGEAEDGYRYEWKLPAGASA